MRILLGEQWKDGYLDYACGPEAVRVRPLQWANVAEVRSQYFELPRSLRLVWNYVREVGVGATLRKIRSRSAEAAHRNKKIISVGVGVIVDVGDQVSGYQPGDTVGFIAANHPLCVERVVVPACLLFSLDEEQPANTNEVAWLGLGCASAEDADVLLTVGAWNELSGNSLPDNMAGVFAAAEHVLSAANWSDAQTFETTDSATTFKAAESPAANRGRKTAVLYGYGNYAKTMCLPNVSQYVDVQAVHEIDPAQMPQPLPPELAWSSQYWAEEDQDFDVYLIASYHHTHAGIAEYALNRGAYAVVEKPIVTTFEQLHSLRGALQNSSAGLYSGFHKRYARYNDWIFEDLQAERGSPISMHSIVFEMPLPRLHWYRWKNSCGRVVANGCHWIDHFLFIEGFHCFEHRLMLTFAAPVGLHGLDEITCILARERRHVDPAGVAVLTVAAGAWFRKRLSQICISVTHRGGRSRFLHGIKHAHFSELLIIQVGNQLFHHLVVATSVRIGIH